MSKKVIFKIENINSMNINLNNNSDNNSNNNPNDVIHFSQIKENNNNESESDKEKCHNFYPKNEEEENEQLNLALKLSEETELKLLGHKTNLFDEEQEILKAIKESEDEEKLRLCKIKEEEDNFLKAIEESKKLCGNIEIEDKIEEKEKEEEVFDEEYGICPITQEYMTNPVITPSGNYYEKSAIINWLNKNGTDPITREQLTVDQLIEDEEYKNKIIEYRKKFNI